MESPIITVAPNTNYVTKVTVMIINIAGDGLGCQMSIQVTDHIAGGLSTSTDVVLAQRYQTYTVPFTSAESDEINVCYNVYCDDSTAEVAVDNVFCWYRG